MNQAQDHWGVVLYDIVGPPPPRLERTPLCGMLGCRCEAHERESVPGQPVEVGRYLSGWTWDGHRWGRGLAVCGGERCCVHVHWLHVGGDDCALGGACVGAHMPGQITLHWLWLLFIRVGAAMIWCCLGRVLLESGLANFICSCVGVGMQGCVAGDNNLVSPGHPVPSGDQPMLLQFTR